MRAKRTLLEGLYINPDDLSRVTGCTDAFKDEGPPCADEGRIEFLKNDKDEISLQVVVGDMTTYANAIDVEYDGTDFDNMLALGDMLDEDNDDDDARVTAAFQYSMSYKMKPPKVTKKASDLDISGADMEYAMMALGILRHDTPLYNPNLGTVQRMITKLGSIGAIYICKDEEEKVEKMKMRVQRVCDEKVFTPNFIVVTNRVQIPKDVPVYAGRYGIPNGLTNSFALELNPFHPQVASHFISSIIDRGNHWSVMYSPGVKLCYLDYQKSPNFYRYHHDAYYTAFVPHYKHRATMPLFGFYNYVNTSYDGRFSVKQQQIIPLSVEARYYDIDTVSSCRMMIPTINCSANVLMSDGKILDIDLPLAPECRDVLISELAGSANLGSCKPLACPRTSKYAYTVGGSTSLHHYSAHSKQGFKAEVYENYEMLMSSVIWDNVVHKFRIPYKTCLPNIHDTTRGLSRSNVIIDHNGTRYLVESFDTHNRRMINPITSHWFEFDNRLHVVYDMPGDFMAEIVNGVSPLVHSNYITRTMMESTMDVGASAPSVSLITFVQSLAGTYQEFVYWAEHRTVLDPSNLSSTIDVWSGLDLSNEDPQNDLYDDDDADDFG